MLLHCFGSAVVLLASLTSSDPIQVQELVSRLEATYRSARTLEATFLERYAENGQEVRSEAGTVYFRRPGRMRWEYEKPDKDLFLVDGKTAWFYVPADHTVSRMPAKKSGDLRTPLAILAGRMKISHFCLRVEIADTEKPLREGNTVLRCKLRGQQQADAAKGSQSVPGAKERDEVFFEVARVTGELARIVVHQAGGIEVEFCFENWRFDPAIADSMFLFEPPAGVAIVNGELTQEPAPAPAQ